MNVYNIKQPSHLYVDWMSKTPDYAQTVAYDDNISSAERGTRDDMLLIAKCCNKNLERKTSVVMR